MANKPVIDIDVNDAKFQRFAEKFAKYQAALAKVPGQWKDTAKAEGQAGSEFEKILASFFAMGEMQKEMLESSDKDNKNLQKKANLWNGIKKTTGGILDDVDKITKTLLKWGLIGFGAGTAAIVGVRAIAESVSADRRFSLGTGLTPGAQGAFARHQGSLIDDPTALLTGAFAAKSDPSNALLPSLGISRNQSTIDIANQILTKIQDKAKSTPQEFLATILGNFPGLSGLGFSLNTLQQLRSVKSAELQGQIQAFGPDLAKSGKTDAQAKRFTDFVRGVDTTFADVTNQFEKDLIPLLDPIKNFVAKVGDLFDKFLTSGAAAAGIDALTHAIDRFASYLGSAEFKKDVDDLLNNVDTLHRAFHPVDTVSTNLPGIPAALSSWELATVWAAKGAQAAKKFNLPEQFLQGQVASGNFGSNVFGIAGDDRRILDELKAAGVPLREQFQRLTEILAQSRTQGFDEKAYISRLGYGPQGSPRNTSTGTRVDVTIHTPPGGNMITSVAQATGGVQ